MRTVLLAVMCFAFLSCQSTPQEKIELKTQKDSVSYSLGLDIGENLKQQSYDVDLNAMTSGQYWFYRPIAGVIPNK